MRNPYCTSVSECSMDFSFFTCPMQYEPTISYCTLWRVVYLFYCINSLGLCPWEIPWKTRVTPHSGVVLISISYSTLWRGVSACNQTQSDILSPNLTRGVREHMYYIEPKVPLGAKRRYSVVNKFLVYIFI